MATERELKLLAELGSGSFGAVYHAVVIEDDGRERPVALKVLHPTWSASSDAARRLRDEARILSRIDHPNVVRVEDVIRVGGREAVLMEYVPGEDANAILSACRRAHVPFPVRAALEVVSRVADALHAVWDFPTEDGPLKVIHRDVKPSNVRITPEGRVVVLDFGIARAEFSGREAVTRSVRYGSRQYMAPERWAKAADTPAGDAYGLGCLLYELLIGEPFGDARRQAEEHAEKVERALPAVAERVGLAGEEVVELVRSLLSWSPSDRATARYVAERCAVLARRVDGDDLRGFAAWFVPRVPDFVASTVVPLDRRVDPQSLGSDPVPSRADPTVDVPTGGAAATTPLGLPSMAWVALAMAVLAVLTVLVIRLA